MYEDRQCNAANLIPSVTNTPLPIVKRRADRGADGVPRSSRSCRRSRCRRSRRCRSRPSRPQALIPDELLQRIQQFAFGGSRTAAPWPAPPCRKQGPFEFGGERTQYPHVNARGNKLSAQSLVGVAADAPAGCCWWWSCWSAAGAALALRLAPSAATATLVGSGSDAGRATTVAHERFGDDAVYVLVRGDLPRLVLTSDLNRLLGLEGCLSGNVPEGVAPPGGASRAVRPAGARRSRRGSSTGRARSSTRRSTELTKQLQAQTRARAAQAERAQPGGAAAGARAGPLGGARRGGSAARRRSSSTRSSRASCWR